jgi:HD-like signal output (HDOD) protein
MIIDDTELKQILLNIQHIGTPHPVSLKIIEKASTPDFNVDELAGLIAQEPTIAAQILKVSNSVGFSRGQRISTIKQAVLHLGSFNVKSILFAIEVIGIFKGKLSSSVWFNETTFWKHSIAGAIISSKYAKSINASDPEIFYLASLIRNIGVLAIRQFMPGDFERILLEMKGGRVDFREASKRVLKVSHRAAAYLIALEWHLPTIITDALSDKINPFEKSEEVQQIRKSISIADDLLQLTKYCVWDEFYSVENIDMHGIPCEVFMKDIPETVEKIFQELWT